MVLKKRRITCEAFSRKRERQGIGKPNVNNLDDAGIEAVKKKKDFLTPWSQGSLFIMVPGDVARAIIQFAERCRSILMYCVIMVIIVAQQLSTTLRRSMEV
uniref:Uncharacterized protein n=1 Tax=Pseudictyota dubia TaxID=2749911 RepID=A0A7R9W787_9STRA|mmetsp:Transcript_36148/g.66686  ORF Transcript_36148/g.66686 Transcript_36148/m.66686 type:complete len:101 (+) Transcript_36148:11-313(+)